MITVAGKETVYIAVHDTVVVVAAAAGPSGIVWRDVVQWVLTVASISIAALITQRGWRKSSEHAQAVRDSVDRQIIIAVLRNTIWRTAAVADSISGAFTTTAVVPAKLLHVLTASRRAYDEHWPKIYVLEDKDLVRRVVEWFTNVSIATHLLGTHIQDGYIFVPSKEAEPGMKLWSNLGPSGRELHHDLGFEPPPSL